MKNFKRCLIFTLVMLLLASNFLAFNFTVNAQQEPIAENALFVAPNGNDNYTREQNDIDHPWATPQKAWENAQPGDTVYFRGGTYYITSTISTLYAGYHGTVENPITFRSYPGETATLDGGTLETVIKIERSWNIIKDLNFTGGQVFLKFAHDVYITGGLVENCHAQDYLPGDCVGFVCVDAAASDITIKDCRVIGPGAEARAACIIAFNTPGLKILHNELSNANQGIHYKHGKLMTSDTGIEIAYNYIHDTHNLMELNTGYAYVHDNLMIGTDSESNLLINMANGSPNGDNNKISHNTFYNTVLYLHEGDGDDDGALYNTVENNIFMGIGRDVALFPYKSSDDVSFATNEFDYNLHKNSNGVCFRRSQISYDLAAWQSFTGQSAHSSGGSPIFSNGSGSMTEIADFSLAQNSPGKNTASDGKDLGADISLVIDPYQTSSDKLALNQAITAAQGLSPANYTEESWNNLEAALEDALEVQADEMATQEEVDTATNILTDAISSLESASTGISLDCTDYALRTAGTRQTRQVTVTAEVTGQGNIPLTQGVLYSSGDEEIATVDSQGLITAVAEGWTVINAVYEGSYAQAQVFVLPPEPDGTNGMVLNESSFLQEAWLFADDFNADRLSSYYDYYDIYGRFGRNGGSDTGIGNSYGMQSFYGFYSWDDHPDPYGTWLKLAVGKTTDNEEYKPVGELETVERELYWRFYVRNHTQTQTGTLGTSPIAQIYGYGAGSDGQRIPFMSAEVYYPDDESGVLESRLKTGIFDSEGKPVGTSAGSVLRGSMPVMSREFAGQWHMVEIHVRLNDSGESNGQYHLWVDDQLQASADDLDWVGEYNEYGINEMVIYNTNQYPGVTGDDFEYRMFDNSVVSRSRIGESGVINSSNADLVSILPSAGKRVPDRFNAAILEYTIELEDGTDSLQLAVEAAHQEAGIMAGGISYSNAGVIQVGLQNGTATVNIEVTAPNGTTKKTYVVNVVTRKPYLVNEAENPKADWIFWDDFEEDRMYQYFDRTNDEQFYRSSGAGLGGSTGMKAEFKANDPNRETGSIRVALGRIPDSWMYTAGTAGEDEDLKEVYMRFYVKHEKGYKGQGNEKMARISAMQSNELSQSMIAHIWSGGADDKYIKLDPASGTDAAGNLLSRYWNDWDNLRWLGAREGSDPILDEEHSGEWYAIETHVKLNDPGMSNGIFELWVDDVLQVSMNNLNWIGSFEMGEGKGYGINWMGIENYCNQGVEKDQERYFDNLVISRSKIGLAEVESVVENPVATLAGPAITGDGTYKLTYGLEKAAGITAQDVTVSYDKNLFDFVSASPVSDGTGIVSEPVVNAGEGTVRFILAGLGEGNEVNGKADILDMFFMPKANGTGTIAVTSVQLADKTGREDIFADTAGASKTIAIVGNTALISAIQAAREIYNNAAEGIQTGQYPYGTKDRLDDAINAAAAVRDDEGAAPEDISNAIEALNTAVAKFQSLIITDETGDINDTPGVSLGDLGMIAYYYGKTSASEGLGWDAIKHMDINGDGEIGLYDLAFIVRRIIGILN